jgi:hypothetical protein
LETVMVKTHISLPAMALRVVSDLLSGQLFLLRPPTRLAVSLATMALVLSSPTARSTSICRWVNENGQSQIAEVVPERYKKVAICTDSQKYELSPDQRRAAEQRAAESTAKARQAAAKLPAKMPSVSPRLAEPASQPSEKRPIEVVTEATDCPTWWRIYDESVECFGPYRTTRGATKAEAFDKCNVVPNPEPKCGPRSN